MAVNHFRYVTREEMRQLDRRAIEEYAIPSVILMENAGGGIARRMMELGLTGPVAIFCGKGNNGGDGFVVARHLHNAGYQVQVFFVGEIAGVDLQSDPGINLQILQRMGIVLQEIHRAEDLQRWESDMSPVRWLVDALFGTGLTEPVREPTAGVIACLNRWQKPVIAVDLPSGLDANTGAILGAAITASYTMTLALPKIGFTRGQGPQCTGIVEVIEISIPRELLMNV